MSNFVWFGSRGALAKKYTWKVMFDLYQKGQLDGTNIHAVGSESLEKGRKTVTDMIQTKSKCLPQVELSNSNPNPNPDSNPNPIAIAHFNHNAIAQAELSNTVCESFKTRFEKDHFTYAQLTRTKDESELTSQYARLNTNIEDKLYADHETRIYYLSVPDSAHVKTVEMIKKEVMPKATDKARFIIEKPFGSNLEDVHRRIPIDSQIFIKKDLTLILTLIGQASEIPRVPGPQD